MDDFTRPMRRIKWVGSSLKDLRKFPEEVQKDMGDELQLFQYGTKSQNAKSFKGVGSGVFEIALRYDTDAYRSVLAVQIAEDIYVLHCFKKKSKSGIATPKQDVDLVKQRYKIAVDDEKKEKTK